MPAIPLAATAAAKAAPAVAAATKVPPVVTALKMFGSTAAAGIASGLGSGLANRTQHVIQRGRPNYGVRQAAVQAHEKAFAQGNAYTTAARLKELEFDQEMLKMRYADRVQDRRQEESNHHQLVMAAMGGAKGIAQAFKEAVSGQDLDRLIAKYNYLNKKIKEEPSSDGWPPEPKIDSSRIPGPHNRYPKSPWKRIQHNRPGWKSFRELGKGWKK